MSGRWVAASVRGRGLARRGVGGDVTRAMAVAGYEDALAAVCQSPYGAAVRPDMDVRSAGRAVWASALWHLRILAGWGPPLGAGAVRVLTGGFELANLDGLWLSMAGGVPPEPFDLGSLARVWQTAAGCTTPGELRRALASSAWGDPGSDDPASMRVALRLMWARQVLDQAPGAEDWAVSAAALIFARVLVATATTALSPAAIRDLQRLLGRRAAASSSLGELRRWAPRAAARILESVGGPEDLWGAEVVWWSRLEDEATHLARQGLPGPASSVGVAGLLAADAWRVAALLQTAARGAASVVEPSGGLD